MELNAINATSAIKAKKPEEIVTDEAPKTAFINSAFGFGFNNDNKNAGTSAAFQA